MRILVVTNMYPVPDNPVFGIFVLEQVEALRARPEIDAVDVMLIDGREGVGAYFRAIPELRRRVKRGGYDLVHAHYGLAGAVAAMQRRVPVVVTYHSGDIDEIPWQRQVSRVTSRLVAANICVSARDIVTLGNKKAIHLTVGLDNERFAPKDREMARRELGIRDGALALLFPGPRDRPKKAFPRFEEVVRILRERGHDVDEHWLEGIERDRVVDLLAAVDAVVMTSVSEGAPVAIMEAMAAGVPIVATPVGDVPLMLDGDEHAVVAEFDAERFATTVEEIVHDGPRSPAPRSEFYSQRRVVERLMSIYGDVV